MLKFKNVRHSLGSFILCSVMGLGIVGCSDNDSDPVDGSETEIEAGLLIRKQVVGHGWKFVGFSTEEQSLSLDKYATTDFCLTETELKKFAGRTGSKGIYMLNAYAYESNAQKGTVTINSFMRREQYRFLSYKPATGILTIEHTTYATSNGKESGPEVKRQLKFQRMSDKELQRMLNEYEDGPYKFTTGNDGVLEAKGAEPLTSNDFRKHLVGYGWKFVEGHIVFPDTKLDANTLEPAGWTPAEYYIEKDEATKFVYIDEPPCFRQHTGVYAYAGNTFELDGDGFTVLSYDEQTQTLAVIDKMTSTNAEMKLHFLEFYQRMTEEELAKVQKEHAATY